MPSRLDERETVSDMPGRRITFLLQLHTEPVYTAHMREKRDCWVCDICGFAWLASSDVPPSHCASSKCRSRQWNSEVVDKHAHRSPLSRTPRGSAINANTIRTDAVAPTGGKLTIAQEIVSPARDTGPLPMPSRLPKSCPDCGSMGMHQRWCKKGKQ